MGFYLQPAVGGRSLSYAFWRRFVEIPSRWWPIKIAPFNRYQTLDVVRAVVDAGRSADIALYTGNDDHIVEDLAVPYRLGAVAAPAARIVGGLLGHWAVWTRGAVGILARCQATWSQAAVPADLLFPDAARCYNLSVRQRDAP